MSHLLHVITEALVSYGIWGLLLLSFLDSAGVPVPAGMDALLILVAVKAPERAYLGAAIAVGGSVAGNLILFLAARKGRQWARKEEQALAPGQPGRFENWVRRYGLLTIFVPAVVPVIPLPLKIFVIASGAMRTRVTSFLLVILVARAIRYFVEAYVGIHVGTGSMAWFQAHVWEMALIAAAFCAAVYGIVRWRDQRR